MKLVLGQRKKHGKMAKGLVKREVVEILTPGTAMNAQLLEDREHNYCLAVHIDNERAGIALIDVSTGDFMCGEENVEQLHYLLQGKNVREVVWNRRRDKQRIMGLLTVLGASGTAGRKM